MLSCTAAAATHFAFPSTLYDFVCSERTRTVTTTRQQQRPKLPMRFVSGKESGFSLLLGFSCSKKKKKWRSGFVGRCRNWDGGGDFSLEAEIFEFMRRSKKPGAFPSKKELVEAGREDLAEAIAEKGGWLSLGWDLEEEEKPKGGNFRHWDWLVGAKEGKKSVSSGDRIRVSDNSLQAATSSSGRSVEAAKTEDDSGIEGVLNRLEKERNLAFGLTLRDKEDSVLFPNNDKKYDLYLETSTDAFLASRPESLNPNKAILNDSRDAPSHNRYLSDIDVLKDSPRPEMWRTWSLQRAGFSDLDFEAAEFSYDKMKGSEDVAREVIFQIREGANEHDGRNEPDSHHKEINHKQLRSRINHLESELSCALRSLRSKADEAASEKGCEGSSDDLRKLSDAWEFQETEIVHAQNKLRSTRAKLAVLEGKMAMAIIDAQKIVEEKQKRINDARRALRLLRTAYIVWPNSASEVLIAGSYDGWTTQRKMEKSSTGIFSLCLKLYPGRYEIKFIVDGEWRIDPLRPIVRNNGYENNVLIIT